MITNREEVLEKAFKVFVKMNYEKASFTEIAKACGLSRAGIIHYFPYKLDLFVAVVDKFVFQIHHPNNKFDVKECTLKGNFLFISSNVSNLCFGHILLLK